jgi:N-acetylmuramoyl-L-alanine amidase
MEKLKSIFVSIISFVKEVFKSEEGRGPIISKPIDPVITPPIKNEEPATTGTASKYGIKKIALIIGHGHGDPGAPGFNRMMEFDYNSKVARILEQKIKGKEIKLFWRGASGITGVNTSARLWDDDLSIELHCNSYNGKAKGCEVLTLKADKVSIKVGQDFAKAFCSKFGRVMRDGDGVKELSSSDRGHYSLALVNDPPPSILLEPFFIDNPDEWIDPEVYAQFLIDWISTL